MFERIVVPLDGSELAASALPEAQELARLTGAKIRLVRVVDYTMMENAGAVGMALDYASSEDVLGLEHQHAVAYLQTIASQLQSTGLPVETDVYRGRVARVLAETSEPGDIIVMTSHGRGGLSRWFLGSVAEDLIRHANVPVLLVRARPDGSVTTSETERNSGTELIPVS